MLYTTENISTVIMGIGNVIDIFKLVSFAANANLPVSITCGESSDCLVYFDPPHTKLPVSLKL